MDAPGTPKIGSPLLVPFDGSANAEAVLPFIPLLADGKREVMLLQIVPKGQIISGPMGEVMLSATDVRQAAEQAARANLAGAAARLKALAPDLKCDQIVASGEPAEQIVDVARRRQARTIVMASQGVSGTGPGGFGSVVGRVARITPVPLVIVQPGRHAPDGITIARLVVPHDGSERAARVFPLVKDLAQRLAANVHLVAVVEDEESPLPANVAAALDPHLREEAQGDALNVARQRVESVGANLLRHGLTASWDVLVGPAAPAILARCAPRDMLVITSHGQTGSPWLLGSVAERLIRESSVPVVLLRTPPDTAPGSAT
jgi:nucleotide-binding universal stress UspA family protein